MSDTDIRTGYRNTEKVPGETQNVKNPVMFELTARQLAFIGMALVAVVFVWLIACRLFELPQTAVIILCLVFGCPFLAFGFISPSGLNLEEWLALWSSNNIKSTAIRKFSYPNAYERVANEYQASKEKSIHRKKRHHKNKTESPAGSKAVSLPGMKGKKRMYHDLLNGKINGYFPDKKLFCYRGCFFRIYELIDYSRFSDMVLMFSASFGYEYESIFLKDKKYLVIGINKNSDRYKRFLAEDLNTSLLMSNTDNRAIGIEELAKLVEEDDICSLEIKKAKDSVPFQPFFISTEKKLHISPGAMNLDKHFVKSLLIAGFYNTDCKSICERITSIDNGIKASVHFRQLDTGMLIEAIPKSRFLNEDQRSVMNSFVNECHKKNEYLFNACMFVSLKGSEQECSENYLRILDICNEELLEINPLLNQQKSAYMALLPLLCNQISGLRTISGTQLARLVPVTKCAYEQEA